MPIDTSIYNIIKPQQNAVNVLDVMKAQGLQQENLLAQQKMEESNAIRSALSDPSIADASGEITPEGLRRLQMTGTTGLGLAAKVNELQTQARQQKAHAYLYGLQALEVKGKITKAGIDALRDATYRLNSGVQAAIKQYGPEGGVRYAEQNILPMLSEELKASGHLSTELASQFGKTIDPKKLEIAVAAMTTRDEQMKQQQLAARADDAKHVLVSDDGRTFIVDRDGKIWRDFPEGRVPWEGPLPPSVRSVTGTSPEMFAARAAAALPVKVETARQIAEATAKEKGWKEFEVVTPEGVKEGYRSNANAGLTQKKVGGNWVDVDTLPADARPIGGTAAATVAATKDIQTRVDNLSKELKISEFQRGLEVANRVSSKLADPKQGIINVTTPEARSVVTQFERMVSGYRPFGGGKYQDEQIKRMNGLVDRAQGWIESWGTGDKLLNRNRMLELTTEMKNIVADQNAALLREELNIAQGTEAKGGKRSALTMRGKVDDVVKSGRGFIMTDDGKRYIVFGRAGETPTREDTFPLD